MGELAAILTALSILSASRGESDSARVDCRYSSDEETTSSAPVEHSGGLNPTFLPQNDVFRPILADQREPRFYADYRRVHFRAESLLAEGNGNDTLFDRGYLTITPNYRVEPPYSRGIRKWQRLLRLSRQRDRRSNAYDQSRQLATLA